MALSNSFDFTVTRDELIHEAMERAGVLRLNKQASADERASFGRSLNLRLKAMQASGLQLFTYRDAFLFLEADEDAYLLGPTGDHATESYVKTRLATDEATSSTSLGVDSITGISNGDNIGIELDNGTLFWTTVNGVPAGSTVVITTGLTSAATTGNYVFAYTTKIQRPLKITDMFVRDVDNQDRPVELVSISEYRSLSNKTSEGSVVQATYDPQLTNSRLLVWPMTDDVTDVLAFTYKKPIDDFDTALDVRASRVLIATGNAAPAETVTIAGTIYTFVPSLSGVLYEVLIGATASETLDNLKAAINDIGGTAEGITYGIGTEANTLCQASTKTSSSLLVEARVAGTSGNGLGISETCANLNWFGAALVLSGGTDSNAPAYPADWFEYLVSELMPIVAAKFSLPLSERQLWNNMAQEARMNLWDNEETSLRIQPRQR